MRARNFYSVALVATFVRGDVILDASMVCSKPAQRREWRTLTIEEQVAFIDAVKCLGNLPHSASLTPQGFTPGNPPVNITSSRYDDFVYAHMDTNILDHFTALFFPWHRWLLKVFSKALQDECNYQGAFPYWNWSLDADNVTESPVFNPNEKYGLGTFGTCADNYTVHDGAFSNVIRAYPYPHLVTRHFDPYPFKYKTFEFDFLYPNMIAMEAFNPEAIESIIDGSKGNFTDFAYKVDGARAQGPHNAVHLMLPGDMKNLLSSPNDIIFYLHHGMLDCIWDKWQNRRPENAWAFGGGLTMDMGNIDIYPAGAPPAANVSSLLPTVGLSPPVSVWEMMSTKSPNLCYECIW
ncbi:Tyrosinase tyrosinase: common central domain containing protein [Ceratobasidium theobromae]|uniref:Tyrosinase tyrosinase: common central domain containing protein n=1 Tax=Ceratobasidium theobromae TaxID=1582974 RepID=A0A5N5QFD1_9AGAM|nr:Tyrosinase tyrosinase: common central domain containing protein [Ceratobasidium theobromae]